MAEEEEAIKALREDMDDWESFYNKYKHQLDKVTNYEERIQDLEKEITTQRGGFSSRTDNEKMQIFTSTAIFIVAALMFMRIISKSSNQWLFFFGGLLVGVGAAGILKMWTM